MDGGQHTWKGKESEVAPERRGRSLPAAAGPFTEEKARPCGHALPCLRQAERGQPRLLLLGLALTEVALYFNSFKLVCTRSLGACIHGKTPGAQKWDKINEYTDPAR